VGIGVFGTVGKHSADQLAQGIFLAEKPEGRAVLLAQALMHQQGFGLAGSKLSSIK
jgi:hypothetical protein